MATQVQFRGGTTTEHSSFTGAAREVTVDTTKDTAVVHDGSRAGGHPLLREDGKASLIIRNSDGAALSNSNSGVTATTGGAITMYTDNASAGSKNFKMINTSDSEVVTFDNTGAAYFASNVGIGVSPSANLDIKGSTPTIELDHDGSYLGLIQLRGNDLEIRGSNGQMEFYTGSADGSSSTHRMRITDDGDLEIGAAGAASVTITAAGTATFAGTCGSLNSSDNNYYAQLRQGRLLVKGGESDQFLSCNTAAGAEVASISNTGTAYFDSQVNVGDGYSSVSNTGTWIQGWGGVYTRRGSSNGADPVFQGGIVGAIDNVNILASGAATFKPNSTGLFRWVSSNSVTYVEIEGDGEANTALGIYDDTNSKYAFRLNHDGAFRCAGAPSDSPGDSNNSIGFTIKPGNDGGMCCSSVRDAIFNRTSDGTIMSFKSEGSTEGSISISGSTTNYNTSSDYRLKENIVEITDGIDRLKQLKPSRFNFKTKPDKTVDGFVAHEVSSIVPEAVTGEKDAMKDEEYIVTPEVDARPEVLDEEGNVVTPAVEHVPAVKETRSVPDYQGIDQAKLTPLLTAALQEAIAKIETLETKVAALEAA